MCFKKPPKDHSARDARDEEAARQARIRKGTASVDQAFAPFTNDYFDSQRKSYLDYSTPALNDQYAAAKKALVFALARNGTLQSTVAGDKFGELKKRFDSSRVGLEGEGARLASEARNNVESARGDLLTQLHASADPASAATSAVARAKLLSQPQGFSPVGQLFSDFTDGLASLGNSPAAGYQGLPGLFRNRTNRNAVQVVA